MNRDGEIIESRHVCNEKCMEAKQRESEKYEGRYRFRDTKQKPVTRKQKRQHRQNVKAGRR